MRVSEIFESIQGEGTRAGVPSVFLRLADCNLRCRWCDTKYTWDWQHYDRATEVTELGVSEVAARLLASPLRNLVITGGEPLLQQEALTELVERLGARGARFSFEVETAGTLVPAEPLRRAIHLWNVSPKLANSGNERRARLRPEALRCFAGLPRAWFKFVVDGEGDLPEIHALLSEYAIARERVLLMPQAGTRAELAERSPAVAALCRSLGVRFGPRLQVALWGARRGI
ncbi:MAG: 7-carboxy-7-deazaguanine synthase QueE [Deltaproteobacteria bacterium]|nr:MAG: 7-carboxy-7-deazaguanine synthase QueE [Deltaproteobacteria bacterium]